MYKNVKAIVQEEVLRDGIRAQSFLPGKPLLPSKESISKKEGKGKHFFEMIVQFGPKIFLDMALKRNIEVAYKFWSRPRQSRGSLKHLPKPPTLKKSIHTLPEVLDFFYFDLITLGIYFRHL